MSIYSFSDAISEIKYYQRYEMHEEAIGIAAIIDKEELGVQERLTLYKLMALSYRKIGSGDYALVCINRAICLIQKEHDLFTQDDYKKDFGILLMNKGVVFHSRAEYESAIGCYNDAISLFKELTIPNQDFLVNSFISMGEVYIDLCQFFNSLRYFRFAAEELKNPNDVRWGYIQKTIVELEQKIQDNREVEKDD